MSKFDEEVTKLDYRRTFSDLFRWQFILIPLATLRITYVVSSSMREVSMSFTCVYVFGLRVARIHRS